MGCVASRVIEKLKEGKKRMAPHFHADALIKQPVSFGEFLHAKSHKKVRIANNFGDAAAKAGVWGVVSTSKSTLPLYRITL